MTVARVLAGEARWHVEQGDCLDVLRAMPDASVDAVVTDPPAGIAFMGKGWDTDRGGRDAWIAWLAEIMREALRALRPGGHALVWALPRTSHWTATAIEDAGFEIRDVGVHLFGSGFPKSLDVSKAIDREAGATREVVGSQRLTGRAAQSTAEKGGTYTAGAPASDGCVKTFDLTAPATPLAERWNGWGTALKPASEHWILARKPLVGTVAANVAEYGTGAINVDACRISAPDAPDAPDVAPNARARFAGVLNGGRVSADEPRTTSASRVGRWPANVTISHLPECREVGVRRVRRNLIDSRVRTDATERAPEWGTKSGSRSLGRIDETVPAYDCAKILETRTRVTIGAMDVVVEHADGDALDDLVTLVQARLRRLPDSHTEGTESTPARERLRDPRSTSPQGSRGGCPSSCRSCDALARQVADGAQASPQQLGHALESVLARIRSQGRTRLSQESDRPSSSDASLPNATRSRTSASRTLGHGEPAPSSGSEPSPRSEHTGEVGERLASSRPAPRGSRSSCKTSSLDDTTGNHCGSEHSDTCLRSLVGLAMQASYPWLGDLRVTVDERIIACCAVAALDEQSGERRSGVLRAGTKRTQDGGYSGGFPEVAALRDYGGDAGGASRFYYVAKASQAERAAGLPPRGNTHTTVKPIALMRWLARLVTPPGGVVLDPFTGSGSTGCACALEGFRFVGIEREAEYVEIARARIAHWEAQAAAPAKPRRAPKPRPAPPPPSLPRPVDERQLDLLARMA